MAKGEKCVFYKHGWSQFPIYAVYIQMVARCHNPNHRCYPNYGGRGIAVCDEWRNNREVFFKWAETNGYKEGLSLDRIDNNKGYSPENCRWTDRFTQQNNTRRNRKLKANGEVHSMSEWARIRGMSKHTIEHRLELGWSEEDAVLRPVSTENYKHRLEMEVGNGKDYQNEARKAVKESGLYQYQIARVMNVSNASFSKNLRKEVSLPYYNKILKAISESK